MKFLRQNILILVLILGVGINPAGANETNIASAPSLGSYLEAKGFSIEPFPCQEIVSKESPGVDDQENLDINENKPKEVHEHRTCLIEGNSRIGEENFGLFEKSFQEGHDMMIFGQQKILDFFKVNFYQDDIPKRSQIVSSKNSLIFIDDSVGEKEFSQCIRKEIIRPVQEGGVMGLQWLCSQNGIDHLQQITFISPDIVFLSEKQRGVIFEAIQGISIEEGKYEEQAMRKGISWIKAIFFGGVMTGFLWMVVVIRKLVGFAKKEPQMLIRRIIWGLLLSIIIVVILYSLGIFSKSILEIYAVFYILASIGLAKAWGGFYSGSIFQKLFPGNNKEPFFQQWSLRWVSICGVGWLYTFFLWPAQQMIPIVGLLIGASMLIITNGCSEVENRKYQKIIFEPLKWLPLIFLGIVLWNNFSVSTWQTWKFENIGSKQGITLTDLDGKALDGFNGSSGMILGEPTLITVDNPNKMVGKNFKSATIYASIESKKTLSLISRNGQNFQEESIFSIPNQEKYSLIAKHDMSGLEFYRNRSASFIKIPQDETIQKILDTRFNENDVLSDLSQQFKKHYVIKPTFGFLTPTITNESIWDIPLSGNHNYEFFVEVKEKPLSLDLSLTKFGTKAMGSEFIDISILNDKELNQEFYHEEINYEAYQDQSQHIHIEEKLDPGIYKIQLQPVRGSQIYLQKNTETAYRFDRIESNSPTILFYVNDMNILGEGEIVFYDVGDQTVIEQGSIRKLNFRKKTLETISFSDEGGRIRSSSPLLIASSVEKWRSPFTVNKLKNIRNTTQYILVEKDALGTPIQSEEEIIIEKKFSIPKKQKKLYWRLIPEVEPGEKTFYSIKEITIKFL